MRPRAASRSAGADAALLDGPAELLLDAGHALGDELVGDVDHGRLQAGLDGHLDDARAHLPGPRDQHLANLHRCPSFDRRRRPADLPEKASTAAPPRASARAGVRRPGSARPYATIGSLMDCKFLDSYQADLDGNSIDVWYCRKRDPFVLGPSREVALRTCSGCRLSDHTRPPSELAYEVERRNQELVALNAIVSAVNSSLDLSTVLNTGLDKAIEILQVDAGWIALAAGEELHLALHRGVSDDYARAIATLGAQEGVVGLVAREQETAVVEDVSANHQTLPAGRRRGARDDTRHAAQGAGQAARRDGRRHPRRAFVLGRRHLLRELGRRPARLGHRARPAVPRADRPRRARAPAARGGRDRQPQPGHPLRVDDGGRPRPPA